MLKPGQWTDDTQLTLVVAESLIANGGSINMDDMAARHVAALEEARRNGLGWGRTTTLAVERLKTGIHWSESGKNLDEGCGAGNGVAMKMVPIAALFVAPCRHSRNELNDLFHFSAMTHATGVGIAAGVSQAFAICHCLMNSTLFWGDDRFDFFQCSLSSGIWEGAEYAREENFPNADTESLSIRTNYEFLSLIVQKEPSSETLARIFGAHGFHAADSLPTVWAFFLRDPRSIETLYDVVNWSGDADSNGALVGALLGALNGLSIFPQHLLDGLWQREVIEDTANRLCAVLRIE